MFCPEGENKKEPEIEENKDVNEEPKKEGNVKMGIKRENDFKEIEDSKNIKLNQNTISNEKNQKTTEEIKHIKINIDNKEIFEDENNENIKLDIKKK